MDNTKTTIDLNQVRLTLEARELFIEAVGSMDLSIARISPVETSQPGDLVFVDKNEFLEIALEKKPTAVVLSKKLAPLWLEAAKVHGPHSHSTVFIVANVALAHAILKTKYANRDMTRSGWPRIHPSSVVHESAEIHETAVIEPKVVIAAGTKIAAGVRIMAGVVIEHDVSIGENTILHPSCVIGYGTVIGRDAVVGAGSIIGSEGYGFAQDTKRRSYPIPQTGIVVLEDRVRIGANCCIDRATYLETRIRQGTKLDNLCHIAHNVDIGEDCLLTSMFCVAGSTKIGNRVIASGQSGVIDHIKICDDVVLLHRAGVTKDIEVPGAYGGLPTQPLSDYLKNSAVLRSAVDLKKRVTDLETAAAGSAGPSSES